MIFVFGSNLSGRHGAGSARAAFLHYGAKMGVGEGPTGNSYALPTVGKNIKPMDIDEAEQHVRLFLLYAEEHPDLDFQVTCVGCGLAGFTDSEIAPLFASAPSNCLFDEKWKEFLPSTVRFWGSF